MLESYVSPIFCNIRHTLDSEKQTMKKRSMLLFPKEKAKSGTKKKNQQKDTEDIAQVLAASIVKLSVNPDNSEECKIAGCQVSEIPGVIADSETDQFRQKVKTGIRTCLEKRYESVFRPPPLLERSNTVYVKDGMQDLFMSPLLDQVSFGQYFKMWWDDKIRRCFAQANTVVIDFDKQYHSKPRPKESLQVIRDNQTDFVASSMEVSDDTIIPSGKTEWESFLHNRKNKASLVHYLCRKMKESSDKLHEDEMLIVSFEGNVFEVVCQSVRQIDYLANNHNESDTRVFFLLSHLRLEKKIWIIRSTDVDILFTALLNFDNLSLQLKNVYIHYNSIGQGPKYCFINELVASIENDPHFSLLKAKGVAVPKLVGLLHFVTGCDDLSFLRGFTRNFCFGAFVKLNDLMCDSSEKAEQIMKGDSTAVFQFVINFFACIYSYKFASSFNVGELSAAISDLTPEMLLSDVRKRTWHQTIYKNNTLPSLTAIHFHSRRLIYVLSSFANATEAYHNLPDPKESGWIELERGDDNPILIPEWDSEENRKVVDLTRKTLLKRCGCGKNQCSNNRCSCRKEGKRCTTLCTCVACTNVNTPITVPNQSQNQDLSIPEEQDEYADEASDRENETESDNDSACAEDSDEEDQEYIDRLDRFKTGFYDMVQELMTNCDMYDSDVDDNFDNVV